MKKAILFLAILLCCKLVFAQTSPYTIKYPVKGKLINIEANDASIEVEGYTGNDLIIEPYISNTVLNTPQDAADIPLIQSAIRKEDNIISPELLKVEPNLLSIRVPKSNCRHLRIKVPENAHLKISFTAGSPETKISFKNLSGELEIEGTAPIIELTDISGPLILSASESGFKTGASEKIILSHLKLKNTKTISGDKNSPFLNIISSYADVDIALPPDLKATIQADIPYGDLFSDLNLTPEKSGTVPVKNRYSGELNGGGKMIVINAAYGNVFLRKQK